MRIAPPNAILTLLHNKGNDEMTMTATELDALLGARFSCRAYRSDPVPAATIEQIVATAQQVPSWCNAQPWQLNITTGDETDRFRAALQNEVATSPENPDITFPTEYSGIYRDRRRACGWQLYDAVGVEKGDRTGSAKQTMQNFALFGAPHTAIVSSPAQLGPYGAMDAGGFVTAFTIAAQSLGVATIAQAAVARHGPFLHRCFDIPDDRLILCAISFGYGDMDHPANSFRTPRADVSQIIQWHGQD